MLRSRRFLIAVGLALALVPAGWIVLHGRAGAPYTAPSSSSPPPPSAGDVPATAKRVDAGSEEGGDLADILEPEGGQLTDMLGHLQVSCAAAAGASSHTVALPVVTRCVEDAEGVMNLVELLRGTIEGPAGAAMPADVRRRWDGTLSQATATVRRMLIPVWDGVGQALARGGESPAEFRALGHLRDRIGRVLTAAGNP